MGELYCLVFDGPIPERRTLISTLRISRCTKIAQGPTDYSLEFRLDTSSWEEGHWMNWDWLITGIHKGYGFNWERSCLPEKGGDRHE